MELKFLTIDRKAITFGVTVNPDPDNETVSTEERTITAHEAPLPELITAFAKLSPVICEILEMPPEYQEGLVVSRIAISYTKAGTRSVQFKAVKQLESRRDLPWKFVTPMMQLDKPADGESGEVQLDKKSVALVTKAIKTAEDYANGKRSQTLLNFDEAKAALNATAEQGRDLLARVH